MNALHQPHIEQRFNEDGFVVLENVLGADVIQTLLREASDVCRQNIRKFDGSSEFETLTPDEIMQAVVALHFPHKLSSIFRELLFEEVIVGALSKTIGPNIKCMQSMLFIKHAGRPGQAWHQDELFIPTTDDSLVGVWIALDNATIDNGCLWVIPGSHKSKHLWPSRNHNDARFDRTPESYGYPHAKTDAIAVEINAGDVLLFDGYLLHRSLNNVCDSGYRRSYVSHYMSADAVLSWSGGVEKNFRDDYRDIVLIAGQDAFAEKGTEELSVPYVRPE